MSSQTSMIATGQEAGAHASSSLLERMRRGAPWWTLPVTVVVVLGAFIVYSAWTAHLEPGEAHHAPYLSPFWSPTWFTGHVPVFPALFALIVPIAFRGSCYYYRKAYYRSFFWDPPGCAVPELRHRRYRGESALPMAVNNLHRYAMYLAVAYIVLLGYDAAQAFHYNGSWYLGLGTLIMIVNVVLLAGYTFGCHSLRHLAGGGLDCFSCSSSGRARHRVWRFVTALNERHPMWAWISMFSVAGVDIYIRMLNAGWFLDPHIRF